jgi:hypothetical protein
MKVKCVLFVVVGERLNSHGYSDDGDDKKCHGNKFFPLNFGDYVYAKECTEDFH